MTSLSSTEISENLKQLTKYVLDLTNSQTVQERTLVSLFIHHFQANPNPLDLGKLPLKEWAAVMADIWTFVYHRSANVPKIEVRSRKFKGDSLTFERTVITVINDDMPFLVDSLLELLHSLNLKSRRLLHPILPLNRDKEGNIETISEAQPSDQVFHKESLIYCEIVDPVSPSLMTEIQEKLEKVLFHVQLATSDWHNMRQQTNHVIQEIQQQAQQSSAYPLDIEVLHFLEWIKNDHFTYLGYGLFDFSGAERNILRHFGCENALGILKDLSFQELEVIFKGVRFDRQTRAYLFDAYPLIVNKASLISRVHRGVAFDVLITKRFNEAGHLVGIHLFLGLFTSITYDSNIRDIPLLRRKADQILDHASLSTSCYDGKSLIHILNSLPRDDLFQASVTDLTHIGLSILSLQERQQVALFVRRDQFNRFLSCLVHVPRDRFDSALCERMGVILAQELKGRLSDYKAQYGSLATARIHYIVYCDQNTYSANIDLVALEQKLTIAARSWLDDLYLALQEQYDDGQAAHLYRAYKQAFSKGYQERFHRAEIMEDIKILQQLQTTSATAAMLRARLYETSLEGVTVLRLKVYQPERAVPLSNILPLLENLDLKIIKENSFSVVMNNHQMIFWIHEFKLESNTLEPIRVADVADRFHEAFYAIHQKKVEDDGFNRLVLRAGLTIHQCLVLRIYYRYLRQLGLSFSREYIEQTLVKYPDITRKIVDLFEEKFDPSHGTENVALRTRILEQLEQVESPDEDRILRRYLNLVIASLRTNYFQHQDDQKLKDYISIKFDARQIDEMPLPRPMFEIFVYSTHFEGIHLRGGKVARGGIRWSDRFEDFRTEILGLIKAQMVKNTVIVPVGSKGGFVVKSQLINPIRDEIIAEGVTCYQNFIRGLLDLTDNLVGGQPVHPDRTICWDEADPYLVVAADKGTATFSDYANEVSKEYKFWLDDAFASGGSAGYDHKKMAITARGAWESVKRHFLELGHNIQAIPFRVVGVGDMSGDVFGNGMLLSRQIKLVAAFNHQHIFVDPQPDLEVSFQERERLFALPRSSWNDYNPNLISKGGGVFERRAKTIPLSAEMQRLLTIKLSEITPTELIRHLLLMPTDLLWFGGIGTFVKSSKESHLEAGDRTNDALRVNGKDLQCRVIGEGANLGMTQLGRIEFAQKGGRLNTDAIDNSAGVDCSDHEVNLKILFSPLIINKDISLEDRNKILAKMTDEIAHLILQNNYAQTQALSLLEVQGIRLLDEQIKLIRHLEGKGLLNRAIEFLPDDGSFVEMQTAQRSLTRPELAVLLAYGKIDYYEEILNSSLLKDYVLEENLLNYFPENIQQHFRDNILTHPLKREIIATLLINDAVNRLGPGYLYDVTSKLGCSIEDGFRAYLIVLKAFDLPYLWNQIETLQGQVIPINLLKIMVDILTIIRRIVPWLLRHYDVSEGILTITNVLKIGSEAFLADLQDCLDNQTKKVLEESIAGYENLLIGADLSQRIAVLQIAASSPDIILIASRTQSSIPQVARIYFEVGVRFNLALLRRRIDDMKTGSMWQRLAISGVIEDLYVLQSDLVNHILKVAQMENLEFEDAILIWCAARQERINRVDQLNQEILSLSMLDLAAISVLLREFKNL